MNGAPGGSSGGGFDGGDFDVVLRILPIVPVLPSPFAYFLRNGPIPFVLGPLNGGLPWPEGFPQLDAQRRQAGYWVSRLRGCYRYMPFARSTYQKAAAIIAGSSHTFSEFASYGEKLFFVPGENGLESSLLQRREGIRNRHERKLQFVFVGRLIPLKACDLALRGSAHHLRTGAAHFTVVGDGPERKNLQDLAISLGIEKAVTFTGWVSRAEALDSLVERTYSSFRLLENSVEPLSSRRLLWGRYQWLRILVAQVTS